MANSTPQVKPTPEVESDKQAILRQREIDSLENSLSMLYYELGKKVYETVEPDIMQIGRTVDSLIEAKREQVRLTHQKPCPQCLALNPDSNAYCGKCGSKLT